MKPLCLAALGGVLALAGANAEADAGSADAIGSSLSEILSFATLGTVTTRETAAEVTRRGADYLVRLPLKGFSTPTNAAVNAVARPRDGGGWDITSMTFPSSGTVETIMPKAGPGQVSYSIGEQAIHVMIDPAFTQPSSFTANLGDVVLRSDQGGQRTEQTIDRYIMDGTLSSEAAGQLNFVSRGNATNWHLTAHGRTGVDTDGLVRKLSAHLSVQGLDQAQGTRLLAAARAIMGGAPTPGQPPGLSAAQRQDLRDLVDSLSGLLATFAADETLDGIRFSAGPHASGTLGRIHVDMAGNSADDRISARMDMAVDDFAVADLPADAAAYIPRHVDIKSALAGVPTDRVMALLRELATENTDPAALQARLTGLFSDPGARAGIESITFDSGPLRVTGSASIVPRADGKLGMNIHISASGMDTLIAQAQGKPSLQQGLPLLFMAKGVGRPDGNATVWDITVGDGPLTINGTPFGGQPAARTR